MKYSHICLGGTFDHLHRGHESILDFAFSLGETVSIGIVSEDFHTDKQFQRSLQPFTLRKKNLQYFLTQKNYTARAKLFTLKDAFGIAPGDKTLEAVVVTVETKENALKINKLRIKNGLVPLKILVFKMVKGTDKKIIRSTRIRKGIINRDGDAFLPLFMEKKKLILPRSLRATLRKPLGIIIEGSDSDIDKAGKLLINHIKNDQIPLLITVGDIVTKTLIQRGISPRIAIIDHKTQREKNISHEHIKKNKHLKNPPGTIHRNVVVKLYDQIQKILNHKLDSYTLAVNGEEDLLALPAILFAPLGSVILYGQRNLGVIVVTVTEEVKKCVSEIIQKFE